MGKKATADKKTGRAKAPAARIKPGARAPRALVAGLTPGGLARVLEQAGAKSKTSAAASEIDRTFKAMFAIVMRHALARAYARRSNSWCIKRKDVEQAVKELFGYSVVGFYQDDYQVKKKKKRDADSTKESQRA